MLNKRIDSFISDLILTDIRMPGLDGLELLSWVRDLDREVMVVVITAFGSVESAVEAMRNGAFTGAVSSRPGYFRKAYGGTLFLDEIGEVSAELQVKLLRAVQEREVTPVGCSRAVKLDVRLICATNRDLEAEVRAGRFCEDLFYRINVVQVPVPPLRERRDDIPLLVDHLRLAGECAGIGECGGPGGGSVPGRAGGAGTFAGKGPGRFDRDRGSGGV